MKKGEPVYLIYLTKTKKHKHQTKLEAKLLGLFVCKKRLGKENAQWITGNYATQSARQKKKSYLSEIEPITETCTSAKIRMSRQRSLRSTMPRKTQASTEESMRVQSRRRAGRCSCSERKGNSRAKSFENKEDGQKPFPLRKAFLGSLPKREQACKKMAELLHQA